MNNCPVVKPTPGFRSLGADGGKAYFESIFWKPVKSNQPMAKNSSGQKR